ncbi:MAG: SAM-dependent methyltransferase [Candidatus Campbellbacteria bacterium GW2011_GWD1_35_49]|nr:MAG: SmtA2, SAM-dependent methyltransferase [Candidatus Campbellbacteria bacterium GW2011_OD1_34_28]KKP74517.1 MAG: SAM-dependent methyltransferase [Candidatus Campbellbacteria bacterium GW2011_GWD2_35_24]KKP76516.1 MAG: SAM-dependent methyltransferase [Candidatus Campbellbacteria bacterium GW2011_GWC1_35_31]KKP78555.1 MAG: SAM-dependent methyltransferase [Candidatus Campbellbacteria bacterium GW2011_GWD1_35_49]HAP74412.1 hypothetical protein [Candidatus Campbellbacteria bacterium]
MQKDIWEKEYRNPKLVTGHDKPQSVFLKFLKWYKTYLKTYRDRVPVSFEGLRVLDLGSGTGRNANYLAEKQADVFGMEISQTAIDTAKTRAGNLGAKYIKQSIGEKYSFENEYFDLVIDITSSNSLDEAEREIYLSEVNRVLRKDGIFFVRALCKDGDKNAQFLLKNNSAREKDTYIMPETGLIERVFSKDNFIEIYSKYFKILDMKKTESYSTVNGRVFKRKFWVVTMQK